MKLKKGHDLSLSRTHLSPHSAAVQSSQVCAHSRLKSAGVDGLLLTFCPQSPPSDPQSHCRDSEDKTGECWVSVSAYDRERERERETEGQQD